MGSLVTSIFTFMLGWVRSSAVWLRNLLDGNSSTGSQWLGEHWIFVFIALCVIGALIDLAVYLARWQPFRVWRSTIARIRNRGNKADETEEKAPVTETENNMYAFERNASAAEPIDRMEIHVYTGNAPEQAALPAEGQPRRRRASRYPDQTGNGAGL
ncbi:MAG: hypothetical protein Q4G19_07725 [Clostridia bacterium]|nr:hypothetical protein [Clostridia bacterium]